jgi:hypothetical protein
MTVERKPTTRRDRAETVWDFEGTRRHHIQLGLRLSPAERLRWLEETVDEMRQLLGLARKQRNTEGKD